MEIYLDNAATTKPCSEAVEAALDCMTDNYGNPSSLHARGLKAQIAIDEARKKLLQGSLSCPTECVILPLAPLKAIMRLFSALQGRSESDVPES